MYHFLHYAEQEDFFICASPLLGELLANFSLFLHDWFPSPAALVWVQMLTQHWQAPLSGNAFLPLRECIPSFAGFDIGRATGALGKSRRTDSSFSGMHFDGEEVACFDKLSRWSGHSLDSTAHCSSQISVSQDPYQQNGRILSEKERVMEMFALRSNLVLACINPSFISLSSGAAVFFVRNAGLLHQQ